MKSRRYSSFSRIAACSSFVASNHVTTTLLGTTSVWPGLTGNLSRTANANAFSAIHAERGISRNGLGNGIRLEAYSRYLAASRGTQKARSGAPSPLIEIFAGDCPDVNSFG